MAVTFPGTGDCQQDLAECRHVETPCWGEVGASIEGFSARSKEHRHWPSTLPGHGNNSIHVDTIQVRSLFTIHLDVDKVFVHQGSRSRIFERFMCHNVAPMAGSIADAQKDRFILSASFVESFLIPRVPINWVIGML